MASVATKIFRELVEGVFYIHNMGIVHRDLKVSGGDSVMDSCLLGALGIGSLNSMRSCAFTHLPWRLSLRLYHMSHRSIGLEHENLK